ncbi:hypothetical protein NP233_g5575 [Leucocoprinus birnbaumii]|uniref:F-box domain-containing protein n=1 Tax=Leucocoprinus birnbaumii TaxID=56174 RepID=A0AAD5YRR5_9AGAR|nr:hypothetical protein NP233_g5575 [Leucocoprinus birnbaumii]
MPPWHPVTTGGTGLNVPGKSDKDKVVKNPVSHWRISRKAVVDFVFSPDVKYVAAISEDGCLRIIDALAEQLVDCYASYFGALTCVAWSPDGRFVLTGGQDDLITIFSPWEQRVVARCQGHSSFVSGVAFDDLRCDGRTYRFGSVGEDNKLILWDFSSGALHRPKFQATHHQRMSMSSTISLAFRGSKSASYLPSGIPPNLISEPTHPLRYHPAPSRNEIAIVQPVLVKPIESDLLTDVAFLPRVLITATKCGHIKLDSGAVTTLSAQERYLSLHRRQRSRQLVVHFPIIQEVIPESHMSMNPSNSDPCSASSLDDQCSVVYWQDRDTFDKLPSELITQIFDYAMLTASSVGLAEMEMRHKMLANLQLVSQQWRSVVIGTPMLWSSIVLRLYSTTSKVVNHYSRSTLSLWLKRSGTVELRIMLEFRGWTNDYRRLHLEPAIHEMTWELLGLIWKSVHRWRTLDLRFRDAQTLGLAKPWLFSPHLSLTSASSLKSIHLNLGIIPLTDADPATIEPVIQYLSSPPNLRELGLQPLSAVTSRVIENYLPINHLHKLKLNVQVMALSQTLFMLSNCASLSWLSLDIYGRNFEAVVGDGSALPALEIPTLLVLEYVCRSPALTPVLQRLHCPELQVLSISFPTRHDVSETIHFFTHLEEYAQLKALRLEHLDGHQLQLVLAVPVVARIPILEVLTVGIPELNPTPMFLGIPSLLHTIGSSHDGDVCGVAGWGRLETVVELRQLGWPDPESRPLLPELFQYHPHVHGIKLHEIA